MEGLQPATAFADLAAGVLGNEFFTVLDIGCSGGIDPPFRRFGERLRAFGFDPNLDEVARLNAAEALPHVTYVPCFVGVPPEVQGAGRMATGNFFAQNPWGRLAVRRTTELRASEFAAASNQRKTEANLWQETRLADPAAPVFLPGFVEERGVDDIDFIKIDVDGPDLLILRSIDRMLESRNVLGLGVEVNFFGSSDADVHTFHNVDRFNRFMRMAGFELFDLSMRRSAIGALPAPYAYAFPAQSAWGRPLQGDALYLRDLGSPDQVNRAAALGSAKLLKLAALFSLFGQPDGAAEILTRFRTRLAERLDVDAALDLLVAQCGGRSKGMGYAEYMRLFEKDDALFYPAAPRGSNPGMAPALAPAATTEDLERQIADLQSEVAALRSSTSWRTTAPLRAVARAFGR